MNPDIRPQDDLFGHVNGRWLDETEIPSDRSSWGPFVQLADVGGGARPRDHRGPRRPSRRPRRVHEPERRRGAQDRRPLRVLHGRGRGSRRSGIRPLRPLVDAVAALRDVRDLAAFLGEFERIGGHGIFGSYVNTDDRDSDRYLFHLAQGGLGPAGRVVLPRRQVRRDPREVRRLPHPPAAAGRPRRPGRRRRPPCSRIDTRLAAGHWERAETRDVQKTYNLMTVDELRALCPAFDWDAYVTNLSARRRADELLAESCVRQPSYFAHLSTVLDEVPIEEWRAWLLSHVLRSAAPYLSDDVRRGQLRLLRPHPQRHPRAAGALEARRRAGRGRAGRGGRQGVRRPALPADVQGADGRPRRQPAGGVPRVDLAAGLDDRRDQGERLREARHLPAQDRLPRQVPRLLRRCGSRPTT